jgi:hypothetical protein
MQMEVVCTYKNNFLRFLRKSHPAFLEKAWMGNCDARPVRRDHRLLTENERTPIQYSSYPVISVALPSIGCRFADTTEAATLQLAMD